jgi:predicted nuclease of predicted toxin-antitoxin system
LKFLVDSQLPPALCRYFRSKGIDCHHVNDVGLGSAGDTTILRHATRLEMIIVTKDGDFLKLLARASNTSQQILLVCVGNCRTTDLLAAFERQLFTLLSLLKQGQQVVRLV